MPAMPKDPMMLLSFLNMKLRDEYPSLAALCEEMETDEKTVKEKLSAIGYTYDEESNRFV